MLLSQEELFNHWSGACKQLERLNLYIQNPFDKMLAEGHVTKDEIKEAQLNFSKEAQTFIATLISLSNQMSDCMVLAAKE